MRAWMAGLVLGWSLVAQAAGIEAFSPQGTVKAVRQATARFDAPVVALGDPRADAPFTIDCPVPGSGKWLDERTWAYDFERDLPGATRCSFSVRAEVRDAAGQPLKPETFRQSMRTPLVYDGRNLFNPQEMASAGVEYHSIGRRGGKPSGK